MIKTGQLITGAQLPPEEKLAENLGISRSTLREALGHLETQGLISRRQGIGTFVSIPSGSGILGGLERLEPFRDLAITAGKEPEVVQRTVETVGASEEIAGLLKIEVDTKLVRVKSVEAINDICYMYLDDYIIPGETTRQDLTKTPESVLVYLLEERIPPLSYSRSEIFAIEANEDIARHLAIPVGKPVLNLVETYYATSGKILGVGIVYFVTDNFRFYVTRRAVSRRSL